jgi:hypothetical protein
VEVIRTGTIAAVNFSLFSILRPSNRRMGAQVRKRSALSAVALRRRQQGALFTRWSAQRAVARVVVRITGRQNGGGHILANFAYISRLGHGDDVQVPLYTSRGRSARW